MIVVEALTPNQKKIIDYLSSHQGPYYLRKLARVLALDAGNLSRSIRPLIQKGWVAREKIGNQVFFSLKEGGPRFAPAPKDERVPQKLAQIEPDLIKLTQNLIRIPSVSGEHPERKIASFIADFANSYNLPVKEAAKDSLRPNLIIDSDPRKKETFLLLGHMDTIGAGALNDWEHYPFSGHIKEGKIVGRGVIDMKAGISCEIFTLILLKELDLPLPYNVRLVLVSNEEGGSTDTPIFEQGMAYLIKEGFIQGKAAIYGYGGSYKIGIGHRGVLRLRIKTFGESIHTGSVKWQKRERGINAVTGMAEILLALENLNLPQTRHPAFLRHENIITPGTMILHGGSAVSTVPSECTSVVEVRYLPGCKIREVSHQIKEICEKTIRKRKGLKVSLEKFVDIPAVALPQNEPLVEAARGAGEAVYGKPLPTAGTGPANESFMLIEKGIPTVVFGPLGGNAHAPNEFVNIESLTKTIQVYLKTMENLTASS